MTEREEDEYRINKTRILERDGWICQKCEKKACSLAHRIPKSEMYLKLYGKGIIHHDYNFVSVCANLSCNGSFNIGNSPIAINELVEKIKSKLNGTF